MTTTTSARRMTLSPAQLDAYDRDGYLVIRGLFSPEEVGELSDTFMALHARSPIEGYYQHATEAEAAGDPLKLYPRMMHPHRYCDLAMQTMLHPRIAAALTGLLGEEPLAAQSMFYFKPPGAKGQALHQDNFYLRVSPGSCMAAWVAVDPALEENGGLVVVPGSHRCQVFCPERADSTVSFTTELVRPPAGLAEQRLDLAAGDTLFFNGSLIHGSYPNRSRDRFRRAFICHYVGVSAREMSHWYFPLHDMQGRVVEREATNDGGPCGSETQGPH
jgi:phytanoyl-CoA hydroxylase